ncbi:hypothetical protein HJD18_04320 [Thermoleophilia bacterium SCSIO 60948]|nr:hypothetical protein HJD18_04320 [Thermoleophilia bacterium SCSIO 60948]
MLGSAIVLAACGGEERQDAREPSGRFPVDVSEAKFPREQTLADEAYLVLSVDNEGDKQIPDLAVTVWTEEAGSDSDPADGSFSIRSDQPGLANPNRPVWILEEGFPKKLPAGVQIRELEDRPPGGTEVAQTNTFSFGPVAPGDEMTMVWKLGAVEAGTYTVRYEVSAGLTGEARAVTLGGEPVEGQFTAEISDKPAQSRVNDAGRVVEGTVDSFGGGGGGGGN